MISIISFIDSNSLVCMHFIALSILDQWWHNG